MPRGYKPCPDCGHSNHLNIAICKGKRCDYEFFVRKAKKGEGREVRKREKRIHEVP